MRHFLALALFFVTITLKGQTCDGVTITEADLIEVANFTIENVAGSQVSVELYGGGCIAYRGENGILRVQKITGKTSIPFTIGLFTLYEIKGQPKLSGLELPKISTIKFSTGTQLATLGLYGASELHDIDLKPTTFLSTFITSSLKVTGNLDLTKCTILRTLTMTNCELTNGINLSGNTALQELKITSCGLTELNLNGLNSLKRVDCSFNNLKKLTIHSSSLENLNCIVNELTELTTSSSVLDNLLCYRNKLTSLQVNHISLNTINCSDNLLENFDIYNNSALINLICDKNKLKKLDLSSANNIQLLSCKENQIDEIKMHPSAYPFQTMCGDNKLIFSTMPNGNPDNYKCFPQDIMGISKRLHISNPLDLSKEYNIRTNITTFVVKKKGGGTLTPGTDYTISNGKITFIKMQTDSLYCEMKNPRFPEFDPKPLRTNNFLLVCGSELNFAVKSVQGMIDNIAPRDGFLFKKANFVNPADASKGTLDVLANGTLVFRANADAAGFITIEYEAENTTGNCRAGVILVTKQKTNIELSDLCSFNPKITASLIDPDNDFDIKWEYSTNGTTWTTLTDLEAPNIAKVTASGQYRINIRSKQNGDNVNTKPIILTLVKSEVNNRTWYEITSHL